MILRLSYSAWKSAVTEAASGMFLQALRRLNPVIITLTESALRLYSKRYLPSLSVVVKP